MAEQDIYGGKLANHSPSLPKGTFTGSGAEQDIYGSKLAGHTPSLPHGAFAGSGAEQDVYGSKFADHSPSLPRPSFAGSGAEQDIYGSKFAGHSPSLPRASFGATGAEQDVYGAHFNRTAYQGLGTSALGLLHSAILPSFSLHAGLSAVAYGVSRYADRVEGKDVLWASGMTLNAWWSAIGSRLKRGKDDPRYDVKRKDPGFWKKALFNTFLPEAVAQTIISLPFTIPFRAVAESAIASPFTSNGFVFHSLAIFLFTTGFALETLADAQLESFKKNETTQGINREGVWSIVRHPNYLGDALIHASFPILLLGAGIFHPIAALGPIANYVFLRYLGGDRENEESQAERYSKHDAVKALEFEEYRQQKNSFWPKLEELKNSWTLGMLGVGVAGVVLERGLRAMV
ncbi:hypothetical protein FOC4_g10006354 [Fusarium odoratissimum]|uniref:Steroid 5-alpha reductase C-terminal domain-containing protein n=1 Tax=Fusarium oxysporum f. sp. cubense (strain race 4) TaxID=2502994 RepID=N1RBQ1_FUSC4|nr:hypothetical protein FOC4_g10006354 [Fusarium odoratissimum]